MRDKSTIKIDLVEIGNNNTSFALELLLILLRCQGEQRGL